MIALLDAEARAHALFAECKRRALIQPGKTERALSDEVAALAAEMFGVTDYWHKRIVRAGRNTLTTAAATPPELTLQPDDLVFFDFGPLFGDWEADLGATYVLGDDPRKHRLVADTARAWDAASAHFRAHADLTCAALYAYLGELARAGGWELGHVHCGHLIGLFPHKQREGVIPENYLRADNPLPIRRRSAVTGEPLRWILEVHFVDRAAEIGAFQEALLRESGE